MNMIEDDNDVKEFQKAVLYRRLLYLKLLKLLDYQINSEEIKELELEVYPELNEISDNVESKLGLREVDELRILLFSVDPQVTLIVSATKARIIQMGHVVIRMRGDDNHQRPHFHIEYKREYSASYAIDTFERLAGQMPSKYEEKTLEWASQNQSRLLKIWDSLKKGSDIKELLQEVQEFS